MTKGEHRLTCFGYSLFFAVTAVLGMKPILVNLTLLLLSVIFLIYGIFAAERLYRINLVLNYIFSKIQKSISQIFLFIFYYFILTPSSLLMRILGRDLIHLKIDHETKSYWIKPREKRTRQQFFNDPF